ncbi:hypothetical protein [Streptomyces anthocyanicus]|nr:hypothetical protein OH747_05390 [Streptomyces anthocyanicus]
MTAPPPDDPPAEPGPAPDWWDETPAQAARYDRLYWERDED